MIDVEMVPSVLNGRWPLLLPAHRAARPEWTAPPYWEPERLASMHTNIQPGDIIYDVGAEEGDISALLASWAGPSGGVCLFEPNPRVWPNIRAIWGANNLPPPLGLWVGFASDETDRTPPALRGERQAQLAIAMDGWPECAHGPVIGDHGFAHMNEEADIHPSIRLDDFALLHPAPDVITMDVEGAELRVLEGAPLLLDVAKPLVYVSIHPEFMADRYNSTPDDLHRYMGRLGYRPRFLAIDHEEHFVYVHKDSKRGFLA